MENVAHAIVMPTARIGGGFKQISAKLQSKGSVLRERGMVF